jgi:hypothetical protein
VESLRLGSLVGGAAEGCCNKPLGRVGMKTKCCNKPLGRGGAKIVWGGARLTT